MDNFINQKKLPYISFMSNYISILKKNIPYNKLNILTCKCHYKNLFTRLYKEYERKSNDDVRLSTITLHLKFLNI